VLPKKDEAMPTDDAKFQGHWSTAPLALKDAWRCVFHLFAKPKRCLPADGCSTCIYIENRLRDQGWFDHDKTSDR
jgi:hypothetical protein